MALFDNDFFEKIQGLNASGIVELTNEIENLTKSVSEYENKFSEALSNGTALTKRQRNAYKELVADINKASEAQKAIGDVASNAWQSGKNTKDKTQKKQLTERINLYKELQKQVERYSSAATSAVEAGKGVFNEKAAKRTRQATLAIGQEKQKEVKVQKLDVSQQKSQLKSLEEQANKTDTAIVKVFNKATGKYEEKSVPKSMLPMKQTAKETGENIKAAIGDASEARQQRLAEAFKLADEAAQKEGREAKDSDFKKYYSDLARSGKYKTLEEKVKGDDTTGKILRREEGNEDARNALLSAIANSYNSRYKRDENGKLVSSDGMTKFNPYTADMIRKQVEDILAKMPKTSENKEEKSRFVSGENYKFGHTVASSFKSDKMFPLPDDTGNSLNNVADSTKNIEKQSGRTTASLKNLDSELKQKKTDSDSASSGFSRFSEVLRTSMSTIAQGAQVIGNVGRTAWNAFSTGANLAFTAVKKLSSIISSLVSGGFNLLKSAVSTTLGNMKHLVSGGFNAVVKGAHALKSGLQTIKSHMQSLVKKGTPNLLKSFSSLKSMLMRRVKRTFISSIFNQAKEGLQQLAKHSESFNKAMSNIKNTAKQSAGNLAVTLGSLVQTIEPALITLLGWFNQLLTAINSLFALLSGKGTVTVAKKNTDDYAESLDKAGKSAKDLNHQLYGFDEITRQESDSGSGSGSKIEYEEKEVEGIFDDIMNMFKEGKFREIGNLIGDALDGIVLKIDDWILGLRPEATKWARNIVEILNGIVDTNLFADIGTTIGDGLNLAFDVIWNFLDQFDFYNFGQKIADGINNMFAVVEWDLVGATVAEYFNSIWDTLRGVFGTLQWDDIGKDFAEGVSSFFSNIDWNAHKEAVVLGINGVISMLYRFVTGVNWTDIATQFVNHITGIVSGINWTGEGGIADLVSAGIDAVLGAFGALVDSDFFDTLATNLGQTVKTILDKTDFKLLAGYVSLGMFKLRNAFWSFINQLDIPNLAGRLAESINSLMTDEKVDKAWTESSNAASTGLNQIITAFKNLVSDDPKVGIDFDGIASTIGTKVGEFLDKINWEDLVSSIGVGATKIAGAFGKLVQNLNLGIKAKRIASGINQFFEQKGDDGKPILESAAAKAGDGIQSILGAFTGFISKLNLESIAGSISRTVKTFFSRIDFQTVIGRISDFVFNAGTELGKLVTSLTEVDSNSKNLGDRISDAFNRMFVDDKGNAKEGLFSGFGESISQAISSVFTSGASLLEGIKTDKIADDIAAFLKSIDWAGLLNSVISFALTFLKKALLAVGDIVGALIDWLTSINWLEVLVAIISSIVGILGTALEGFLGAIGSIIHTIFVKIFGEDSREVSAFEQWQKEYEENAITAVMHAQESIAKAYSDSFKGIIGSIDQLQLADDAETQAEFIASSWVNAFAVIATQGEEEFKELMRSYGIDDSVTNELISRYRTLVDESEDGFISALSQFGVNVTNDFASALYNATTTSEESLADALTLLGLGVDENTLKALDLSNLDENLAVFTAKSGKDINEVAKILMSDNKEELANIAKELGIEVGDDLGKVTPEALKKALLEGKKSVQEASDELAKIADQTENKANMKENAQEAGSETAGSMAAGQEEKKEEVGNAAQGNADIVKEKYEKLPDEVKPYAEQLMEYIVTALEDKDGTVRTAIEAVAQGAVDRAREILAGPVGLEIATDFINGIKEGITNGSSAVITKVTSCVETSIKNAKAFFNYSNGYNIGKNLIVGMHNAVHDYGLRLVAKVTEVTQAVIDTFREGFDEHSPSKVTEKIGDYLMEGLENGIDKGSGDAINSVSNVANAIVDEAENGGNANVQINAMTDGLDVVATKMTRIAQIFSDIADTIAEMGGLEIPTVASGRVVPYRSISNSSGAEGDNASENSLEDAIYNAFKRALNSPDAEQDINITLSIDGRKMADIVTKYQRQQGRAWGV